MRVLCQRSVLLLLTAGLVMAVQTGHAQHALTQDERALPTRTTDVPLRFEHLSVEDGLSQATIRNIIQDRQGFLWFSTEDGLNRYDGRRFTVYGNIPFDPTSLSDNRVQDVQEDASGALWMGTLGGGLNRMDRATETFTAFQHNADDPASLSHDWVASVLVDRSGAIWAGTFGGLNRLIPSEPGQALRDAEATAAEVPGRFTRYVHDPGDGASLSNNLVWDIFEDQAGTLWVATDNGLNRMDPGREGHFTRSFYAPGDLEANSEVGGHRIFRFFEQPEAPGVLWLGTNDGLVRLETETGAFRRYRLDAADPGQNVVRGVSADPSERGMLWVALWGGGLARFDPRTERFTRYRHDPADPASLKSDTNYSVYTDRSGIVWVGSWGNGVSRFDPRAVGFTHYGHDPRDAHSLGGEFTLGVVEDQAGVLWVTTQSTRRSHLNAVDRATGTVRRYEHDPDDPTSLSRGRIFSLYEDRSGVLWMGTGQDASGLGSGGLSRFDRETGRFTHYRHDPADPMSLSENAVFTIYEDHEGVLWVGTPRGGLNRMDPHQAGRFTHYRHDPSDSVSLSNDMIYAIYEDRAGRLWVGTTNGLNRFDRSTGAFIRYEHDSSDPTSLSNGFVGALHERASAPGILWAGTAGGLNRLDTRTGRFTHYTEADGLANNVVYGILEDDQGRLWMSTNKGISRFDPETETFRSYGFDSGLQYLEFNTWAYHKSRRGELFFGGKGVYAFYPEQLWENPTPPQVALTGLRLFNKPMETGEDSPLKQALSETEGVHLAYWQKNLTFEFVALHFAHPEQNQYQYRLEGFDADWVDGGTMGMAPYTNLDPGSYTFRVKAANSDGVWNETGASVRVVIAPPWWRTMGAYGLYGLLLLAGLFAVDRLQRRRLIRRERERTRQRELEQAHEIEKAYHQLDQSHRHLKATQAQLLQQEKLASLGQLTAGIAHEIKNPLNFVNNFAALSVDLADELHEALHARKRHEGNGSMDDLEDLLADLRLNAEKISEHGHRADGIVRSMLEHARTQTGQRQATDINALVEQYLTLAYHGMRARHADFTVEMERHYDDALALVEVVPQEMGRVFLNLLNNAFEAVHEKALSEDKTYTPKVAVHTCQGADLVEIRVCDNGTGVPAAIRDKIFEPFFTTKPTGSGTGLGLSLAYDIVTQGHGGTLTVEREEDAGAMFVITLSSVNAASLADFHRKTGLVN